MKLPRYLGLVWNSIFVLTCLYSFISLPPLQSRLQTDARFNFLLLIVCTIIAYLLIVPLKKTGGIASQTEKKLRLTLVLPSIFGTIAICVALANGGSKYFYQLLNSIIIGGGSTILAVGLGTLAAYAFSRFDIAGKDDLLFFILSTRMLPPVVVVIPIYLMYSALGLRDTHFGLILLYTTFNVSFAVWLMKGFIDEIPKEYEDAALVDGYSRFQTFMKVILPQSVTGIAATAVFCLITAWNEFAFALGSHGSRRQSRDRTSLNYKRNWFCWHGLGKNRCIDLCFSAPRRCFYLPNARTPTQRRNIWRSEKMRIHLYVHGPVGTVYNRTIGVNVRKNSSIGPRPGRYALMKCTHPNLVSHNRKQNLSLLYICDLHSNRTGF